MKRIGIVLLGLVLLGAPKGARGIPTTCAAVVTPSTGEGSCDFSYGGGTLVAQGTGMRQAASVQVLPEWRQVCLGRSPYCVTVPFVYPQAALNPPIVTVSIRTSGGEIVLGCTGLAHCVAQGSPSEIAAGDVLTCEASISSGSAPYLGAVACAEHMVP